MTSEEVDSEQWTVDSGERMTPALRRWVKKLEAGYTIRPRRAWNKKAQGLTWRPALFNPEGAYVQRVRLDTAIKLQELGYLAKGDEE